MGFYHPHTLIGDAQRHGVTVCPVDVQRSRFDCAMEPDGAVRMGYRYVKGMGEIRRQRLDSEIELGKYRSLEDFCRRTRLPIDTLRKLATAGAFRSLGVERREALWRIQAYAPAEHGDEIPNLADELEEEVGLKPAGEMMQMRMDFAATELSTVFRGTEFHRPALERVGVLTATELRKLAERLRDKQPSRDQIVPANGVMRRSVDELATG